jgi:hypothetical protein
VYDRQTIGELKTFIRDEMAKMHGSPHDDRVMALAIAVQMMPYALTHHEEEAPGAARWTGQWWKNAARRQREDQRRPGVVPLGSYNRRS